jgi:hypothetical protein
MKRYVKTAPFFASAATKDPPDCIHKNQTHALTVLFLALIFLVRGPFLDSMVHIPDPTLALFFIAGVYLRSWKIPIILLAGTGFTDFYSFQSGVSTFCLSPAYPFLVPTYLTLWFGGSLFQNIEINSGKFALKLIGILFGATFLAFLISSGGFYLLSERFENPTLAEFCERIVKYFPQYIGVTFFYITTVVVFIQAKSYFRDRLLLKN